jgi:hypothetical protein
MARLADCLQQRLVIAWPASLKSLKNFWFRGGIRSSMGEPNSSRTAVSSALRGVFTAGDEEKRVETSPHF